MKRIFQSLLIAGGILAAFKSQGQTFFSFADRGRFFTTSPTLWMPDVSGRHQTGELAIGHGGFEAPKPAIYGLSMSGLYIRNSVILGYNVSLGASGQGSSLDAGSKARLSTRFYTGDIQFNVGVLAFRYKTLSIYPLGGIGAGFFSEHFSYTNLSDKPALEADYEYLVSNPGIFTDGSLNVLYCLPQKEDGGARFAFGLKVGYKSQLANSKIYNGQTPADGFDAIGASGFYTSVMLGIGLINYK